MDTRSEEAAREEAKRQRTLNEAKQHMIKDEARKKELESRRTPAARQDIDRAD